MFWEYCKIFNKFDFIIGVHLNFDNLNLSHASTFTN